jgi:hypothetical protein
MTDISKCANGECPLRRTCWRWLAPANPRWQSVAMWVPERTTDEVYADNRNLHCEGYWECEEDEKAP